MEQVLQLGPVDVEQLVSRNDFDLSQQVGRVGSRLRNPCLDRAAGNADLVDQVAVRRDFGMIGFATQNIDRPAFQIVLRLTPPKSGPAEGAVTRRPISSL